MSIVACMINMFCWEIKIRYEDWQFSSLFIFFGNHYVLNLIIELHICLVCTLHPLAEILDLLKMDPCVVTFYLSLMRIDSSLAMQLCFQHIY